MGEHSYPFDGGEGAAINEDQWSYLAGDWQDNGVSAEGPWTSDLKVWSLNEPLQVYVGAGHANIEGFHFELDADKTVFFAANNEALPRMDRIVLRLDRAENTISIVVKQGVPAASPTAPGVDRSWLTPEVSLATFTVRANSSAVLPAEVLDARDFIGRRLRITDDVASLPEGGIGYRPTDGKFYMRGKTSAVEVGPKVDLSPYATQAQLSNYATRSHTHYLLKADEFNITPSSLFQNIDSYGAVVNGMVHFTLKYRRTSSATPTTGDLVANIPNSSNPLLSPVYFPAYVYSSDLSMVKAAGIMVTGVDIRMHDSFIGVNEILIASGTYPALFPLQPTTGGVA